MDISCKIYRPGEIHHQNASLIDYPNECPICNTMQEPIFMDAIRLNNCVEVFHKCNNKYCGKLFIGTYYKNTGSTSNNFYLKNVVPKTVKQITIQPNIYELSPNFEVIYNQALKAEQDSLDQIAGMGYRKALEFLIKDYLIKFKGKDKDSIESKFLGNCINQDVDNEVIKQLARMTSYVGNDEAHYVKKHEDKDIEYLKKTLDLTLQWIQLEVDTKKALEEIPN